MWVVALSIQHRPFSSNLIGPDCSALSSLPFYVSPYDQRFLRELIIYPVTSVLSTFVSEHVFSRVVGLIFGLLLFGQPVLTRIIHELDQRIPNWKEKLILEK